MFQAILAVDEKIFRFLFIGLLGELCSYFIRSEIYKRLIEISGKFDDSDEETAREERDPLQGRSDECAAIAVEEGEP